MAETTRISPSLGPTTWIASQTRKATGRECTGPPGTITVASGRKICGMVSDRLSHSVSPLFRRNSKNCKEKYLGDGFRADGFGFLQAGACTLTRAATDTKESGRAARRMDRAPSGSSLASTTSANTKEAGKKIYTE